MAKPRLVTDDYDAEDEPASAKGRRLRRNDYLKSIAISLKRIADNDPGIEFFHGSYDQLAALSRELAATKDAILAASLRLVVDTTKAAAALPKPAPKAAPKAVRAKPKKTRRKRRWFKKPAGMDGVGTGATTKAA